MQLRRARAYERKAALISKVLGHKLAFLPYHTLHHLSRRLSQDTDLLLATGGALSSGG